MKLKQEKGIAGVDIAISLIIVTIFIAIIGNLIVNINLNSQDVKRKTIAISYAVQEIEKIKKENIIEYENKGIAAPDIVEEDIKYGNVFTGYHKTIIIKDYVLIKQDITKQANILKKVTVEISYKVANKDKSIQISTYLMKE